MNSLGEDPSALNAQWFAELPPEGGIMATIAFADRTALRSLTSHIRTRPNLGLAIDDEGEP